MAKLTTSQDIGEFLASANKTAARDTLGVTGAISAATLTPAQIMSKAGERLIASLKAVWSSNAGTAHFSTTKATSAAFTVKTSTGYARLINSDGSLGTQVGTGSAGSNINLTIPASGLHRAIGVMSVANGGSVRSGDITYLLINGKQLTSFDGTGLSSLTSLYLYNNQLTSFDGTGLSSLTQLGLYNNQLTSFDGTGLSSLTYLLINGNQLTSFDGTGLSSLITLILSSNQFTSFDTTGLSSLTTLNLYDNQLTSLDVTGLSSLTGLNLSNNQLTSFDGTGLSSLADLNLSNNQLTSIDGGGMELSYNHYGSGSDFQFNNLSATALNSFFSTLGDAAGVLNVSNNPGSATCDPTIATAKGYTVITA
jgi:Leucine-rich repeat (LRR) protein